MRAVAFPNLEIQRFLTQKPLSYSVVRRALNDWTYTIRDTVNGRGFASRCNGNNTCIVSQVAKYQTLENISV